MDYGDLLDTDIVLILVGTKADLGDVYCEVDREYAKVIILL